MLPMPSTGSAKNRLKRRTWPRAARFIFNAYKGYKMIFVDGTDEILYSEDGCTQGDPIAMLLCGVGVKPLFVVVKEKAPRSSLTRARNSSRCCLQMILASSRLFWPG